MYRPTIYRISAAGTLFAALQLLPLQQYAVTYGVGWFAKKWKCGTRYAICGVVFVVLEVLAVRQGSISLLRSG